MIESLIWIKTCPFVTSHIQINPKTYKSIVEEDLTKYSLAGLLTMSVKNCYPCQEIDYHNKKEKLSRLFDKLACSPTLKDKELALVEK